ncbi:MAG: hypothetical protein AVDCRST_MAG83-2157, partial [uncultured Arthrobacter sp.]
VARLRWHPHDAHPGGLAKDPRQGTRRRCTRAPVRAHRL